jgi:septal ring factor EnvC (AmiA/AmiB activator)
MSDGKNGKNGSEKEIDRLLEIVRALARVDTKVTGLDDKLESEIADIKRELEACSSRLACIEAEGAKTIQTQIADIKKRIDKVCDDILDAEKRRSELIGIVSGLQNSFNKLQEAKFSRLQVSLKRWKTYWAVIAFIISPLVSYLVVKLLNVLFHLPL